MPFTYVNRQGRVYYLHVTQTGWGAAHGQLRYYFSRDPVQALDRLPAGFVTCGEVPVTGVPVLKKVVGNSVSRTLAASRL